MDQKTAREQIREFLQEDIGSGDITALATVGAHERARAVITQKQPGVIYGLDLVEQTFRELDPSLVVERHALEGGWREGGEVVTVLGLARPILAGERTALNLLSHLSGVATLTALCVRELEGTSTRLLDTRKTLPGLRAYEKAAVVAGGGVNHRIGLFDAFLIKENNVELAGGVAEAVQAAQRYRSDHLADQVPDPLIEVEVQTLAQLADAITAGAERVLLDNMDLPMLAEAVQITAGRAELEASGGITRDTLRATAETGVDFISMGALTHSAPALDLSLTLTRTT